MNGIYLGAPYRFVPTALGGGDYRALPGQKKQPRWVTGHICYINRAHRFFHVAYEVNGYKQYESFKF